MKRINTNVFFPLLALILMIFALSRQLFSVPPLGKLLDPFVGAVQNETDRSLDLSGNMLNTGVLKDTVHVFFDERKVPHITATNDHDLYFAQGYITARMRLWQMDFLTYVTAGRLSEIFTEDGVLNFDRNQRRIGLLASAKSALKLIEGDAMSDSVLTAYTMGVNAYIRQLDYRNMPLEYKILDYQPEEWTKLKSVLVMKYIANTLSGYEEDFSMSSMMLALGEEKFNKYFPDVSIHDNPLVTAPDNYKEVASGYIKKPEYLNFSFFASGAVVAPSTYNPKLGSNSWVVSGRKTASGYPILCSDPHLTLTLPSVWLEMQLTAPGINVYGVTIPGTPSVIIGFNEQIAWGITNGAVDVKDWYKLQITHDLKQYKLDDKWVPLPFYVEEIKRKERSTWYDTIYYTHLGPVPYNGDFDNGHHELLNHALKWELHNASNEFLAFLKLNRAKNYTAYKTALASYSCPAQNFTFASKDNDIAAVHQGKLPLKWQGQGKFILDGTNSRGLSTGYIPIDSLPHVLNPASQYIVSANQRPAYKGYPYYYSGYYSENRANRIKQLMDSGNGFDIEKMKAIQLDNTNYFATSALPVITPVIEKEKLNAEQKKNWDHIISWKGTYDLNDDKAILFELWWKNIKEYTWDELSALAFYSRMPDDYVLLDLIRNEPENEYFDKQGTMAREVAADIVRKAFIVASADYDSLKRNDNVKWGNTHVVNIMHPTNLPAFSSMDLHVAGHPEAINATSADWGPAWRMIVELGDRPKAYGIFPGGQSGNIGSPYYSNFVNDWEKGRYYELKFFMSLAESRAGSTGIWTLK